MVTEEILEQLGYSSIREYFEHIYTLDMEADGNGSPDAELMLDVLSEEQQSAYELFATFYYYEYHDNKNNEQPLLSEPKYSTSTTVGVHDSEVRFYWPDVNGDETLRTLYDWWLSPLTNRRLFHVDSADDIKDLINDKQFLNIYMK
jgi:hypothetical protein